MGKVIVFCSSIGGTGKTAVSACVSLCLSENGKRVLLVETDPFRPLGTLLQRGEESVYNLYDVLVGNCEVQQGTVTVKDKLEMLVGPSDYLSSEHNEKLGSLVTALCDEYDYIIIDRYTGCDMNLENNLPSHLAVVTHLNEPISLASAAKVAQRIYSNPNAQGKLIINKFSKGDVKKGATCNLDEISDQTGLQILGVIPEDDGVHLARLKGEIPAKGNFVDACERIARRLCNQPVPLPNLKKI